MDLILTEDEKRWRIINFKVIEQEIEIILKSFQSNNIEPILIKGWAASRKYPEKYMRWFSDIDLAVDPADFQKASELIEDRKLIVDLHSGLRNHDTVDWKVLFENSVIDKIADTKVRILCEEDHLRVLCVHWLTDGGAYREKLWDIFYAVENRSENFDWDKCLNAVSSTRRLWIICTIGLAHKYLNLNVSGLPFEKEVFNLPKWLIKAVEKEWASPFRLRPIHTCINDRRELIRQILKRIPPNPIQATVETQGAFDERSRITYQIKSVLNRITPSIRRVFNVLGSQKSGK